jgi:hypothetical protein
MYKMYICIYAYIYVYMCKCTYHVHMYIQREREIEREGERHINKYVCTNVYVSYVQTHTDTHNSYTCIHCVHT